MRYKIKKGGLDHFSFHINQINLFKGTENPVTLALDTDYTIVDVVFTAKATSLFAASGNAYNKSVLTVTFSKKA